MTKKICRSNGSVPTPRRSYRIYLLTLPPSARRDAPCPSQARCSFFRGRADRSLTARTFSPTTPRGPFPPTDPQIAAIDYPRRALFPGEHRRPRFHAAHKADRRDLRLARGAWPCRCSRHSHPPNPGRAKTRPFPQAAMARRTVRRFVPIILPSLLVFSFLRKVDGLPAAICDGCRGLIPAVALRRWRDAVFEGPFRQRLGRTEFAEPSRDRALQFIHRLSRKAPIHLRRYFAEPSQRQGHAVSPRLSRSDHPPSISTFWCAGSPRPPSISAALFVRWCRKAKKGYVRGPARNTVKSDRRP